MITTNSNVTNIFNKNTSINLASGCLLEYNMNSLVDNIAVTSPNDYTTFSDGSKPFKKLFPIDTIIKPFRPLSAGIKYGIYGDVSASTYRDPSSTTYPLSYRTYYPGIDTYYKYWVAPQGSGVDVTIAYPKTIITNKIVARFELSHSTPPSWTFYGNGTQLATGTAVQPFETSGVKNPDAGTVTIYYTGTGWTTDSSLHNTSANVSLTSVRLTTGAVSGKFIGLIELSPKWVKDITPSLISFSVSKESSTSADDILPVGKVSANSLSMDLNSYEGRSIVSFSKENTLSADKTYLYKQIEVKPYFKLYHTDGLLTDTGGKYDKILQGTFYADSWTISEFGDISLNALDGSKILQETLAPSLLCEKYSVTGILRTLLDSVGFTNYNFNLAANDQSLFSPSFWWTDDSKPVWSSIQEICRDSQMIACFDEYNVLQFYTRDYIFNTSRSTDWSFRYAADGDLLPNIQAFSNTDLSSANQVLIRWTSVTTSNYTQDSQPLWKSGTTYMGALSLQQTLLNTDVPVIDSSGNYTTKAYVSLSPITTNDQQNMQALYEYNGYLVIDSEIVEYDAIEYRYEAEDNTGSHNVDITSDADVLKYKGLAKVGSDNYGPTGRYRIKSRGAFNTQNVTHFANAKEIVDSWPGYEVDWKNAISTAASVGAVAGTVASPSVPPNTSSGTSSAVRGNNIVSKSLFTVTGSSNKANISLAQKDLSASGMTTTSSYYSFGTSMFFQANVDSTEAGGGIGFFTSGNGLNGYYVLAQTTSNLSSNDKDTEIKILKVVDGNVTRLVDSQTSIEKSITGIYGATSYKIDVKVKVSSGSTLIDVYINGRKISATDSASPLPKTSEFAMFATVGRANFDYMYSIPLTADQYSNGKLYNIYTGQFANATLDFLYGEKILDSLSRGTISGGVVEEFGTTAREMRKISIKYNSRPGYPLYPSTGVNSFIQVIGSKLSSFGAEVYLLNNAGTYIPLDDAGMSSFSIIGNYVVQSGQHDYVESSINEYTTPEPVIFESNWIQTESDAKSLSKWIKGQWSKQQKVVDIQVFGNPLISVGDVITINYPLNDLDGTQKFVVSSVNNSFSDGLETSITARSIYS